MKTGFLAILLPLALSAGCMYQARVNQQLLQRELRLEEDCIYRLKWQLEDTQRELDAAKAQLDSSQRQTDVLRERGGAGPDLSAPLSPSGAPSNSGGARRLPPAPNLPSVEPGFEAPSGGSSSGTGAPRAPSAGWKFNNKGLEQVAAALAPDKSVLQPAERLNADATVERIIINPGLTGGLNSEGQGDGDHLAVVIEQRDANDARILAPGDVSIAVIDPALPGNDSRVARWNFDADEVVKHVRRNHDGGSLQFELPWKTPPQHSDLRLFVRFTTYDGRRLEANLPIEVQLADDSPGKWRKSKVSLASREDDGASEAGSSADGGRSKNRRSVYETDGGGDQVDSSDTPRHDEKHGAPEWAPTR